MRWYAETGPLRVRQQVLDLAVLVWCWVFTQLGRSVHETVLGMQEPGRRLQSAGGDLGGSLGRAAEQAGGAPLVGDALREPLDAAARASQAVSDAGAAGQEAVAALALVLALVVALLPIAYVLARWLPYRVGYAREASAAARLRGDVELLALRAAATLPMHRLARLGPEPVGRWRRGEPGAAEALAELELQTLGLRPTDRGSERLAAGTR